MCVGMAHRTEPRLMDLQVLQGLLQQLEEDRSCRGMSSAFRMCMCVCLFGTRALTSDVLSLSCVSVKMM
jgi:hypothetical protein